MPGGAQTFFVGSFTHALDAKRRLEELAARLTTEGRTVHLALTAGVFAFLIPFASHRTFLLLLSRRTRNERREPWPEAELPVVTVQLPVFNERHVVERLIDAVGHRFFAEDVMTGGELLVTLTEYD